MLVLTWPIRSCTQIDLSFCMSWEINCWRAENAWNLLVLCVFPSIETQNDASRTCRGMRIIDSESRRQEQVSELRQHEEQVRYEFSKFRDFSIGILDIWRRVLNLGSKQLPGPYKGTKLFFVTFPIRLCTQIDLSFCMCREIHCWRAKNARNSFPN